MGESTKKNRKGRGRGNKKVTSFDTMYMQLLRNQGHSPEDIAEMLNFCPATVRNHTEDLALPNITFIGIREMLLMLIMKSITEATACEDPDQKHRYPIDTQRYAAALKDIEECHEEIPKKDMGIFYAKMQEELAVKGMTEAVQALEEIRQEMLET
jgi:hypothetical protein